MSAIQHCLLWSPKSTSCLWDTELPAPPFLASGTFSFLDYLLLLFFKLEELYLLQNKNLLSDIFSCCIFLSLISHKLINPWTDVEMHLIICSHRIYWSELSSLLSGTSCVVVIDSLISRKKTLGKCHIKLNFSGSFFILSLSQLCQFGLISNTFQECSDFDTSNQWETLPSIVPKQSFQIKQHNLHRVSHKAAISHSPLFSVNWVFPVEHCF